MNAIRSLQFRLSVTDVLRFHIPWPYPQRSTGAPGYFAAWEKLWSIVAGMSALRDLQVELVMADRFKEVMGHDEDDLLTPLLDVRHTERFVVVIGWVVIGDYRVRESTGKPFEIVEMDGGVG